MTKYDAGCVLENILEALYYFVADFTRKYHISPVRFQLMLDPNSDNILVYYYDKWLL